MEDPEDLLNGLAVIGEWVPTIWIRPSGGACSGYYIEVEYSRGGAPSRVAWEQNYREALKLARDLVKIRPGGARLRVLRGIS